MKLHNMHPQEGSTHKRKIVGRGPGSGLGKTSGKGHKGQNARSGGGVRPGFEGGQLPLFRRIPKRGFSNARFKKVYTTVNLSDLNVFNDGDVIDINTLLEKGIIKKELCGLKILGNGTLEKKLTIKAKKFTETAKEKIEKSGGKIEVI